MQNFTAPKVDKEDVRAVMLLLVDLIDGKVDDPLNAVKCLHAFLRLLQSLGEMFQKPLITSYAQKMLNSETQEIPY